MAKCPYCSRELNKNEMWCWHCENDIRREKNKREKPQCFIATVVYGNDALDTQCLRRFRDTTLHGHFFGELFVMVYYRVSPFIAKIISENKALNAITKAVLNKIITIIKKYQKQQ